MSVQLYFLETGSFLEPRMSQQASVMILPPLSTFLGLPIHSHGWLFTWVLGLRLTFVQ